MRDAAVKFISNLLSCIILYQFTFAGEIKFFEKKLEESESQVYNELHDLQVVYHEFCVTQNLICEATLYITYFVCPFVCRS